MINHQKTFLYYKNATVKGIYYSFSFDVFSYCTDCSDQNLICSYSFIIAAFSICIAVAALKLHRFVCTNGAACASTDRTTALSSSSLFFVLLFSLSFLASAARIFMVLLPIKYFHCFLPSFSCNCSSFMFYCFFCCLNFLLCLSVVFCSPRLLHQYAVAFAVVVCIFLI